MAFDPGVLLQSQGIQLPDPMRLAQGAMSLAQLGNQNALAQYTLQKAKRADDQANALNQVLPALLQSGFDPNAVQQALAQHPEASDGIYNAYQAFQKQKQELDLKNAEADKNRSQGKEADIKGKAQAFQSIATTAYQEAQAPNNLSLSKLQSMAQFYGVQLPPPAEGMDPQSYLKMLGDQAMSVKDRITTQETGRHNTAEEGLTQARDTNTANYQRGELGIGRQNAASNAQRAQAAMVTADPFGLSGLNTGAGGGAPSMPAASPGGMQIPPAVQAQRDAQAFDMLQAERAKAPDMTTAAQLDRELQARFPKGRPVVSAGGDQMAPAAAPAGLSSVQGAIQQGLHGDEFLAALPPQIAGMVKGLAEGRTPFPSGAALRSPQTQQLLSLVSQYDPNFDAVNYNARNKTRSDFASGASSKVTDALNQLAGHIDRFQGSSAALNNGSFPWLNQAENAIGPQVGMTNLDARLKQYGTDRQAVIAEAERVFRGSGGSESDLQRWKANFDSSSSPEAQQAAITELAHLVGSRIDAMVNHYNSGMGTTANSLPQLTPAAAATYKKLGVDVSAETGPAPKQAAATPQLSRDDAIKQAMEALSRGAPRDKVLQRLQQMGITDARL